MATPASTSTPWGSQPPDGTGSPNPGAGPLVPIATPALRRRSQRRATLERPAAVAAMAQPDRQLCLGPVFARVRLEGNQQIVLATYCEHVANGLPYPDERLPAARLSPALMMVQRMC